MLSVQFRSSVCCFSFIAWEGKMQFWCLPVQTTEQLTALAAQCFPLHQYLQGSQPRGSFTPQGCKRPPPHPGLSPSIPCFTPNTTLLCSVLTPTASPAASLSTHTPLHHEGDSCLSTLSCLPQVFYVCCEQLTFDGL